MTAAPRDVVTLSDAQLDRIAERVAEHLRPSEVSGPPAGLVDAPTVAQALGVSVKSIYRHAAELGAVRVGRRLRFDLARALAIWPNGEDDRCPSERSQPPRSPAKTPTSGARQTPLPTAHCRLLPVGRRTGPK